MEDGELELPCCGSGVRLKYPFLTLAEPMQRSSPLLQLSGLKEMKEKVSGSITVLATVWIGNVKRNKSVNINMFVVALMRG